MRQNTANADIRQAAQKAGVYLWQIAMEIGVSDKTLTLWMRKELPDDKKAKLLSAVKKLSCWN